jgi:hypothetical protein
MSQSVDFNNQIATASTLAPALRAETGNGATVDLSNHQGAAFVVHVGVVTDGTHTFDPEDSPDGTNWTNIAAGNLSGSFIAATSAADETIYEVGYIGRQRYIRCNVTVTGSPSTGGLYSVSVVRKPQSQPA